MAKRKIQVVIPRTPASFKRARSNSTTPVNLRDVAMARSRRSSTYSVASSRRYSSSVGSRSSRRTLSFGNAKPSGSDDIAVKKGRTKSIRQPGLKKKIAKLNKPMKEAIKKVFEKPEVRGIYKNIYFQALETGADRLQGVRTLSVATCDSVTTGFFMPSDFLHAASVMWNGKTDNQSRSNGDTGNFQSRTFKCRIVNSYVAHTLRNNSQSEIRYTVYTCAPKDIDLNAGTPDYAWSKAYTTAIAASAINSGVSETTWGEAPNKFASFRELYNNSYTTFVLAPGQTKTWSTQGPKDYDMDMSQQWGNDAQFSTCAKYSRFVMIVMEGNLHVGADGKVGRYTDLASGTAFVSPIEHVLHYKLAMPEQVGFVRPDPLPAAGSYQILNQRIDKYHIYNYGVSQGTAISLVDQQEPSQALTAPKT